MKVKCDTMLPTMMKTVGVKTVSLRGANTHKRRCITKREIDK
jgi:hypothetical protein